MCPRDQIPLGWARENALKSVAFREGEFAPFQLRRATEPQLGAAAGKRKPALRKMTLGLLERWQNSRKILPVG